MVDTSIIDVTKNPLTLFNFERPMLSNLMIREIGLFKISRIIRYIAYNDSECTLKTKQCKDNEV